ncbi:cellulose biosynthesis protein BcsD [Sphingomonas sanxanigenens]|uniref:Cellulose synthase operon protein D n=1 Tax=Sphingomonas sanxanigenens DSM 19645 = NX02 TaxID=1123269 RepID=W0ACT7_9SPHN|nr:hypothetical protein [Sphingomonas sanxanigenens]AHE54906.1 hypothetical protein NX02_16130 [Sphingomonas sanxanigenens DSM 19645 = NX02]
MFMGRLDQDRQDPGVKTGPSLVRSLPAVVTLMLDEILASTDDAQSAGFFRKIGERIAGELDVDGIEEAEDLVDAMNGLWRILGWGEVRLELDDEGIDVYHRGMPMDLESDEAGNWGKVAPHILVGAYEHWFHRLGSGTTIATRILRRSSDLILLRHGY